MSVRTQRLGFRELPQVLPANRQFISLSEAVSWIAFQHSMIDAELAALLGMPTWTLNAHGEPEDIAFPPKDAAELDDAMAQAVSNLTDLGSGGKIQFWGRFFRNLIEDGDRIRIDAISPVNLFNYRQFDVLDNALYRGDGLAWSLDRRDYPPTTDDHYRNVLIKRTDLMENFPPTSEPRLKLRSGAESKCTKWLLEQFDLDPEKDGTKPCFKAAALKEIPGLSKRAFDRAWAPLAQATGRDRAGAKLKRKNCRTK